MKNNRYLITISILFVLSLGLYYYFNYSYVKENRLVSEHAVIDKNGLFLGAKEDTEGPDLLIQNEDNTVFVGNRNYDVKPVALDNFGETEISYDESQIDFSKAGDYQLGVIAKDQSGNETRKDTKITVKNKPVIKKQNPIAANNNSKSEAKDEYASGSSENISQKMHNLCRMMGSMDCYYTISRNRQEDIGEEREKQVEEICGSNHAEMRRLFREIVAEAGFITCSVEDWE